MRTWGAHIPQGHIIFYSDQEETQLPLPVVRLGSVGYDDAQDRFTYRIMPHAAPRMAAINASWLMWADDDT